MISYVAVRCAAGIIQSCSMYLKTIDLACDKSNKENNQKNNHLASTKHYPGFNETNQFVTVFEYLLNIFECAHETVTLSC